MISVGTKLSETREKLDKSLKDVEKETKIRAKYLEALEANKFNLIPGDAYVKIFIREYAGFLNIDPAPLIKEYEETHENSSLGEKFAPMGIDTPRRRYPFVLSALLLTLVIGGVVLRQTGLLPRISENAVIGRKKPAKVEPAQRPQDKETAKDAQIEETTPPPAVAPKKEDFVVVITITGQKGSNVEVLVDNELKLDRYLGPGEVREWSAKEAIKLTVSNPSAVKVVKDGALIEGFSDAPGPLTKVLTP